MGWKREFDCVESIFPSNVLAHIGNRLENTKGDPKSARVFKKGKKRRD